MTLTNLDPADEDHDGDGRVVGDLPERQTGEIWVGFRTGEQRVQFVVDLRDAVYAKDDAADSDEDHDDVQDVPESLEVRQTHLLDLDNRQIGVHNLPSSKIRDNRTGFFLGLVCLLDG